VVLYHGLVVGLCSQERNHPVKNPQLKADKAEQFPKLFAQPVYCETLSGSEKELNDCLGGDPPTLSAFGRASLMGKKKSYESRTTGPPEFGSGRRVLGLQIERPVGERRPRICCKHKLRGREGDPTGSQNPAAVKSLLDFQKAQKGFYHSWTPKRTTVQRLSHKRCGKGGSIFTPARATRLFTL
jgi:hypothetical protein